LLEIAIIISLALILFLVLKNYPKSGEGIKSKSGERKVWQFWKKMFRARSADLLAIQQEIEKDQEKILSPKDIELAGKKFMEDDPEITKILIDAEKSFQENDMRSAEEFAISALTKDRKCADAYVVIGKIAFHRGEFEDAKEAYKTALKCNPEFPEAYYGTGIIELKNENYSDAIDNLQKAVSLDRGQAEWWAELGKTYMEVRQFAKATKSLKKATSLDIDNKEYKQLASDAEDKQRSHSTAFRGR